MPGELGMSLTEFRGRLRAERRCRHAGSRFSNASVAVHDVLDQAKFALPAGGRPY